MVISLLDQAWQQLLQTSLWEMVAVVLAVAYLLLAMKESLWCWLCAFFSTAIYTVLFWDVSLLMDSALNVFYMAMAVYGWYQWRQGGEQHNGVIIHRWPVKTHAIVISAVVAISLISGYLLTKNTSAAWPYVDAFTTWASVVTTWMVAKKLIENWLYWIVIDGVSAVLYLDRGLHLTAVLFMAYVVMVVFGYYGWRRHERAILAAA